VKRRVAITGCGIISSIGNSYQEVVDSLKKGTNGVVKVDEWEELGLRSTVAGTIRNIEGKKENSGIPKKNLACMSDSSLYCVLAARDAIEDAELDIKDLKDKSVGCIVGTGITDVLAIYEGAKKLYSNRAHRLNPYTVLLAMSSSASANIANVFPVGGRSYSISSACATSTHNIGHGFELIRGGALNTAIAGGGEEVNALITAAFCAMRLALSTQYNDSPEKASRPYDVNRDGFVIGGGGGIVILEELEHARERGAKVYCEILGYAANSDGYDMTLPEREGRQTGDCMRLAIEDAGINPASIDYINTHGTSTVAGDLAEIAAIRRVFQGNIPFVSSTKSLGGHSLGAAGAHEVIHCIDMIEENFIAPSKNIQVLDPQFEDIPIVREPKEANLEIVMSNNFGFGGTNACIILGKYHE